MADVPTIVKIKPTEPLDQPRLRETLEKVLEHMASHFEQVNYCLVGTAAAMLHGVPLYAGDVDFLMKERTHIAIIRRYRVRCGICRVESRKTEGGTMAELALWGGEAEVKGAVAVDWYDAAEKQALMEVLESRSLAGSGVAVCHRTPDPKLREKYAEMGVQVLLESPKV